MTLNKQYAQIYTSSGVLMKVFALIVVVFLCTLLLLNCTGGKIVIHVPDLTDPNILDSLFHITSFSSPSAHTNNASPLDLPLNCPTLEIVIDIPDNIGFTLQFNGAPVVPTGNSFVIQLEGLLSGVYTLTITASSPTSARELSGVSLYIGVNNTRALNPQPLDGAILSVFPTELIWACVEPNGVDITYEVYFASSTALLEAQNPPFGVTEENQIALGAGYPVGDYYWRVDSIYNATRTVGEVWAFNYDPVYSLTVFFDPTVQAGSILFDPMGEPAQPPSSGPSSQRLVEQKYKLSYPANTQVLMTPQEAPGYWFVEWQGTDTVSIVENSIILDADKEVIAKYEPLPDLDEYNRIAGEYLQFENLGNILQTLSSSKNPSDAVRLSNPGINSIEAENLSGGSVELQIYLAGLLMKQVTLNKSESKTITVDWDGTDYEVMVKVNDQYFSGMLKFTTPVSSETRERGLFFETDDLLDKEYNSELEGYINLIKNEPSYTIRTMKLHGVTVEFHFVADSFAFFTEEKFEQFYYINMTAFHRAWSLFEGYPQDKYYLIYVPNELVSQSKINQEKLGGTIFTTDIAMEHTIFPDMYAHSITEVWFPYLFFKDYKDDIIWISKVMCEMICHAAGAGPITSYYGHYEDDHEDIQSLSLLDAINYYRSTNNIRYLRYLYVKPLPLLRMMIMEYVKNTGNHQNGFFKEIYDRAFLNNPSFDKNDVNSFPLNISASDFKKLFIDITRNKQLVDSLYDKFVYNGEPYSDMPIEVGYNTNNPEFFVRFKNEELIRQLTDQYLNYFIRYYNVQGYKQ